MTADSQQYFALVEEQLAECGQVKIILRGTSMQTTLHEGDRLVLERPDTPPTVGDVVLFRYGAEYRLHRLVAIKDGRCVMQGDNCLSTETVGVTDVVARLKEVERRDGRRMTAGDAAWQQATRRALRRRRCKALAVRWLGRDGRRQLRPWYFALLAFLMWAPLNGVGLPLDNYILGLRADHLLHASVYLPCSLLLMDLFSKWKRLLPWLAAVGIGLLTEGVQYLLPWRGFDINDLVANALGVTLGWMITQLAAKHI